MKINLQYILQGCVKAIDRFNSFFFRYVFVQQKKGRKEYKKKKDLFSINTCETNIFNFDVRAIIITSKRVLRSSFLFLMFRFSFSLFSCFVSFLHHRDYSITREQYISSSFFSLKGKKRKKR